MFRTLRLPDPLLFFLTVLATLVGLVCIFDAGYVRSLGAERGALPQEFKMQILFLGASLAVAFVVPRMRPETLLRGAKYVWTFSVVLLLLVAKFGHELNGAKRWIGVGGFTVQPAEIVKLTAVLYLASVFATRRPWPRSIPRRRDFAHTLDSIVVPKLIRMLPALWLLVAIVLIEKEPDLGTGAVVAATAFMMFFPGGVTRKSILAAVALSVVGGYVMVRQEPYRLERIENHSQRWSGANADDIAYQTVQSELAMATGGVAGVGIGNGRAKHILPATTTDFIMATVGEEFGLLGALTVLGVLGGLVARLIYQANRAPTQFGRLVLFGVAAWIGIQTCVNVMMANGFLPAIGIPLPFVSSGGSSLLALWLAISVCQVAMKAPSDQDSEKPDGPRRRRVPARGRTPVAERAAVHVRDRVRG